MGMWSMCESRDEVDGSDNNIFDNSSILPNEDDEAGSDDGMEAEDFDRDRGLEDSQNEGSDHGEDVFSDDEEASDGYKGWVDDILLHFVLKEGF
jgi:hypothetical protein